MCSFECDIHAENIDADIDARMSSLSSNWPDL